MVYNIVITDQYSLNVGSEDTSLKLLQLKKKIKIKSQI